MLAPPKPSHSPIARLRFGPALLRLAGMTALCLVFFTHEDLVERTFDSLAQVHSGWLLLGLLLYVGGQLVSALRVRTLVVATDHDVAYTTLLADGLKATGLSATLVMGAGDAYRIARLRTAGLGLVEASGVVIADRAIGLFAVASVAIPCLAGFGAELGGFTIARVPSLVLTVCAFAAALFLARRMAIRWLPNARAFLEEPRLGPPLLAFSTIVLALWIASVFAFARSLDLEVGMGVLASAASLVTLATLLPISIGGVGVREAGYVLLLAPYGVSSSEAIALGLLQYGAMIAVSSIAWVAWIADALRRSKSRVPAMQTEADEI